MSDAAPDTVPNQQQPAEVGPVKAAERIYSLDILRGVAILGILVMNIYAFAMPFIGYANPLKFGGTEIHNLGTWIFTHIFFDQKFLTIFAMLFGAGIALMAGRAEEKGAKYGRIYFRRQFWLLIIGAIHAYLIWYGDILFSYAILGLLAYFFRNLRPRNLIIAACVLLPITGLLSVGFGESMKNLQSQAAEISDLQAAGETLSEEQEQILQQWQQSRTLMLPNDDEIREDIETHQGSYIEITAYRIPVAVSIQIYTVVVHGFGRIIALMLIGMALMKTGVLTAERSAAYYRKMMVICYGLGLPMTVYSALDLYAHQFDPIYALSVGWAPNYVGSILVALGHIAMVMLIIKTGFVQRLMNRFACVGRMALTNYLLHSVILTTVFYGYGLGLYGRIPRFWQMGFVVAVITLQLVLSRWWLERYRFGPVEWLWRSVSYWHRQPMKAV